MLLGGPRRDQDVPRRQRQRVQRQHIRSGPSVEAVGIGPVPEETRFASSDEAVGPEAIGFGTPRESIGIGDASEDIGFGRPRGQSGSGRSRRPSRSGPPRMRSSSIRKQRRRICPQKWRSTPTRTVRIQRRPDVASFLLGAPQAAVIDALRNSHEKYDLAAERKNNESGRAARARAGPAGETLREAQGRAAALERRPRHPSDHQ